MSAATAQTPPSPFPPTAPAGDGLLPALLALAGGTSVIFLRGPVPVDETRYLEVARECGHASL